MKTFLTVVRSIGLLVARIAFGLVMIMHGWDRWSSPAGVNGQIEHLQQLGLPQPPLIAWGTMLLEVAGGVLMIFGAFTPAVALFFLVEHAVVAFMIKWRHGLAVESGGYEYSLMLAALSLIFVVFGAGSAAVDALFLRPSSEKRQRKPREVDDKAPA